MFSADTMQRFSSFANGEFCVLCSVLIMFYATVPEAVCMMMASTRSNQLLELIYLIPVFWRTWL